MAEISVIIPTYNRVELLKRALESVLCQRLSPVEIIVVDDGSTDETSAFIADFRTRSIIETVYLQQSNQGPAAARNCGIDAARGCLLAFLDSDDQWDKDKLALQSRTIQANSKYLISHTRERWLRNNEHLNQKKRHIPAHGDIFQQSLRLCCVGMSTVMVHRELFVRYGTFDETLRCCEDYDLWLRVSSFEPFLLIDKALTIKHGGRPDQVSTHFRQGMDRFRIQALAKLLSTSSIQAGQLENARAEMLRRCTIYGNGCLKHGKQAEADYYFDLAKHYTSRTGTTPGTTNRTDRQ